MKIFKLFSKKLQYLLFVCGIAVWALMPDKMNAQTDTRYPFDGSEFYVVDFDGFNKSFTFQFPFYDEHRRNGEINKGNDCNGNGHRWFDPGLNDDQTVGAIIEYCTTEGLNDNEWKRLIGFESHGNQGGGWQYAQDDWNGFNAKVYNPIFDVWVVDQHQPQNYGTKRNGGKLSTGLNYFDMYRIDGRYFAAFKWNFGNFPEVHNKVIKFRMRILLKEKGENSINLTWDAKPGFFITGNPMHTPVIATQNANVHYPVGANNLQDGGKLQITVNMQDYSKLEDYGTYTSTLRVFPADMGYQNWFGYGYEGITLATPPPYTFPSTDGIPKDMLINGAKYFVESSRMDLNQSVWNGQGWVKGGTPKGFGKISNLYTVPPYPQPDSVQVYQVGDKIKLTWKMKPGTAWAENGYYFLWRKKGQNDAQWNYFYNDPNTPALGPLQKPYSPTATYAEQDVYLPEGIGKGRVNYEFCVTRQFMPHNARDMNGERYAAVTEDGQSINTDNTKFKSATPTIVTGGIILNWELDLGAHQPSWQYRIQRFVNGNANGTEYAGTFDANAPREYVDTYTASCQRVHYQLRIMDGATVISSILTKTFTLPESFTGGITDLFVSKGYYNNRVEVKWDVEPGSSFTKYTVHRELLDEEIGEEFLAEILATSLTHYAFTDNTAYPGAYYTYTVRGWVECLSVSAIRDEWSSTGFMQPYGTVSGRVDSPSGMMQEGVNIRATFDPVNNGADVKFKNKSLALINGNYVSDGAEKKVKGGIYIEGWPVIFLEPERIVNHSFTFQAWFKKNAQQGEMPLFAHKDYLISIADNGDLNIYYNRQFPYVMYLRKTLASYQFPNNEYKHISITFEREDIASNPSVQLYIDGTLIDTHNGNGTVTPIHFYDIGISLGAFPINDPTTNNTTYGTTCDGFMDEFRLWNRVLDSTEIKRNYNGYLAGNEEGLKVYYRFDELDKISEIFDISGRFGVYNQNHARLFNKNSASMQWRSTSVVPSEDQLSIKAVTDAQGNYVLNTLPYSDVTTWTIVPSLGMEGQSFSPNTRSASLSQYSNTLNNYNFTNNSVTKLSGTVTYSGGTYPVADCTFEIDGNAVFKNGSLVTSGTDGQFNFDVPNGVHTVQIKKFGHTFEDDGYLVGSNGNPINYVGGTLGDMKFHDKTRVKLIGHIVGGYVEHTKPSGFGLRNNNIGATTLKLTSELPIGYDFRTVDTTMVIKHEYVYSADSIMRWKNHPDRFNLDGQPMHTDSSVVKISQNEITITVSPETGEYVAWLYPETYIIENITESNGNTVYNYRETMDLRRAVIEHFGMLKKSIVSWEGQEWVDPTGTSPGYFADVTFYDTVYYHYERGFYYQPDPTFTITQLDRQTYQPVGYFGEKTFDVMRISGATEPVSLVNENPNYPFNLSTGDGYTFKTPIFRQGKYYSFALEAFEAYRNSARNPVIDEQVPVKNGVAQFTGSLLAMDADDVVLNDEGKGYFSFTGGKPNLADATSNLSALLRIGGVPFYSQTFGAGFSTTLLGSSVTGTNFVTAATDDLDLILHDPPGSNSYAYVEAGSYTKIKKTFTEDKTGFDWENTVYHMGAATFSLTGCIAEYLGGLIESLDNSNEYTDVVTTKISDDTFIETMLFTDLLKTSSSPDFVGHQGDIFVGRGTNTLYGMDRSITIKHTDDGTADDVKINNESFNTADPNYVLVATNGMMMGVQFGTQFYFTTYNLINIQIPAWKKMRDNMLVLPAADGTPRIFNENTLTRTVYASQIREGYPNFGCSNPEHPDYSPTNTEPSYIIYMPALKRQEMIAGMQPVQVNSDGECTNCMENISFTDSIVYFNNNIKMWEKHLADNEKRKVDHKNAGYDDNISFGGGVTLEKSEDKESNTVTFESTTKDEYIYKYEESGIKYMGIGYTTTKESEWTIITTTTEEVTNINTSKIGFVLQDNGMNDQISVDWGYDTISPVTTYMFYTRGGQTSCPYEGEELTEYYMPGTSIGTGTMQIEIPKIDLNCSPGANCYQQINVPAHQPAYFSLKLTNESETNNTGWFVLKVVESTNPHGAILKIDGLPIGDGRHFNVPSGANQVLLKTLTVELGLPDVFVYENIQLILSSVCEPALSDTVTITVEFIPACSDIDFQLPYNNWVMNIASNDSIDVELINFNRNISNFEHVALQYRPISDPLWRTDRLFFFDPTIMADYDADPETKELILPADNSIKTQWAKGNRTDGIYELRARTFCHYNPNLEYLTPPVTGIIDTRAPQSMGTAPSNGILSAGDEISITFNEDIQTGMLTANNFSISGILNNQEITAPTSGLKFNGGTNHAQTEMKIFANGSFAIETWFSRAENSAGGTLFAYGSGNNYISLAINASRQIVISIGNESYTSIGDLPQQTITIQNDDTWKYISLTYNRDEQKVYVILLDGDDEVSVFEGGKLFSAIPETSGTLIVGNNGTKNNGFVGNIARAHFYSTTHINIGEVTANFRLAKSGREPYLIGYWECAEGEGNIAADKARSRHLILTEADWFRDPQGCAMRTSGADFFTIPTNAYGMANYDSFTIEFWFRSETWTWDSITPTTLFSGENGYVRMNASGGLDLCKHDSVVRNITNLNLMDNTYHHFAMSVRRSGNVNFYIDGVSVASFTEQLLGAFNSSNLYFGARYFRDGFLPVQYDCHFNGYFDEIRVWNTSLTRDFINFYNKTKLRGNEDGLEAYYPFETWVRIGNGLIEVTRSAANIVDIANDNPTISYAKKPGGDVLQPSDISLIGSGYQVKTERMVENVPFYYVASNNKIVFNLDPDYYAQVEGVVLDISVKNILDLRGNKCKAENWTAFVRRNPLRWDEDPIMIEMAEGETRTFTARILNTGGTPVNYVINEIPGWLTVTGGSGTLQPMANRILTFTISNGLNVGNYEEAIGITSGNNVIEYLPLQVKVTRQKPNWHVDPNDYFYSMNIIGQLQIDGFPLQDVEDLLGAFVGERCVGLASPLYIEENYCVFATIFGDTDDNTNHPEITFKLWQASTGEIFPVVKTTVPPSVTPTPITFTADAILGAYITPVIFNALSDMREQHIELHSGWNMISINVITNDEPSILAQMQNSLFGVGEMIKAHKGPFSQTCPECPGWDGNLSSISEKEMYMVKVNAHHNMTVSGLAAPLSTQIPIELGWNGIGYIPSLTIPLEAALGLSSDALNGDVIKDQTSFATYIVSTGGIGFWAGSLTHMKAGAGYMYHSKDATVGKYLQYPEHYVSGKGDDEPEEDDFDYKWRPNPNLYDGTMTMTSIVLDGKTELCSELIEIAAFCADECRGSVLLKYEPATDKYMGYLMIYGVSNDAIYLRVYDHAAQREYVPTNEPLLFANNAIIGNPLTPYHILLPTGITGVNDITVQSVTIHPNPVRDALYINHPWSSISHLEVTDLLGRILISKQEFSASSLNVSELSSGIYMLRVFSNGEVVNLKFVKE